MCVPFAFAVAESVHRSQAIEEGNGQLRDLTGVRLFPSAAFGELEGGSAAHIGDLVDLSDVLPIALDEVEHQAFAKRQVTERDLVCAKGLEQRIEQHRTGDDEVGPPRVERGDVQAAFER
jgi:hypothetical protein